MLHGSRDFGRNTGWQLRARLERRRSARRAALGFVAAAGVFFGAGAGAARFDLVGVAVVCALAAFGFIAVGIIAATEA